MPRGILNANQSKTYAKRYAQEKLKEAGLDKTEWKALSTLWGKESAWDHKAQNPNSSAYGIPQLLKMAPGTPIPKQIDKGLQYITKRYGSPSKALQHHLEKGWY